MELMLGSLSDLLYGKLSKGVGEVLKPKRQLGIMRSIADGMRFLHSHNVAHRDLKSANVLFNRQLEMKLCVSRLHLARPRLSPFVYARII